MPQTKPLLSRVANAVYWLGRYIERAENVARFLDVNHNLMLDLPQDYSDQWQPIVDTTGDRALFQERYGAATQDNVVRFLAFDPEYPNSIYSCVLAARENARSVRETISSEMWQQINSLYLMITSESRKTEPTDLPTFCHQVRMGCHLIHGILHVTMSHNEAWQFIRLGCQLERADKTTRLLDVKYFILLPSRQRRRHALRRRAMGRPCSNPSPASKCTASATDASHPTASSSSSCSTANSRGPSVTASASPTAACTASPAPRSALFPVPASSAWESYAASWISPRWIASWPPACTNFATPCRRK